MLLISLCILAAALMLGVAAPAQAADTIQGTVWEGFGVPSGGVTVTAYLLSGSTWTDMGHVNTAFGTGIYSIGSLPESAAYHVGFTKTGFVDQWWANKSTQAGATAVAVVSGEDTLGIDATLVETSPPVITVTGVTGAKGTNSALNVQWNTDYALRDGQFGVWVRSAPPARWFLQTLQPLDPPIYIVGQTAFDQDLTLTVPDGSGYQVIVAYYPTIVAPLVPGDATSWGTSPGSFAVSLGLTVNTPVPATYAESDDMQVVWNTTQPVSFGQFGIWVRSSSLADWYWVQVVPFDQPLSKKVGKGGSGSYTHWTLKTDVLSNFWHEGGSTPGVPVGSGYQVIVAWEPDPFTTPNWSWIPNVATAPDPPSGPMSWGTSPGSFSVTPGSMLDITAVTAPTTGTYVQGVLNGFTVSWTTSIAAVDTDHFAIWARSSNLTSWYLIQGNITGAALAGRDSFTYTYTLGGVYSAAPWVPKGTYQVVVAYSAGSLGPPWDSFGTSVGTFTVVEP